MDPLLLVIVIVIVVVGVGGMSRGGARGIGVFISPELHAHFDAIWIIRLLSLSLFSSRAM